MMTVGNPLGYNGQDWRHGGATMRSNARANTEHGRGRSA